MRHEISPRREGRRSARRIPLHLGGVVALALFLAVAGLPASMPAYAYTTSDVSSKIICQCGCGAVLEDCPHQDCGWGVPAKDLISKQLASGKTPDELLQYYVSQYGQKILAAPTKEGFNITAWVMPFALLIAGGLGIYYLVRLWVQEGKDRERRAHDTASVLTAGPPDDLVRRFNDELSRFD